MKKIIDNLKVYNDKENRKVFLLEEKEFIENTFEKVMKGKGYENYTVSISNETNADNEIAVSFYKINTEDKDDFTEIDWGYFNIFNRSNLEIVFLLVFYLLDKLNNKEDK